MIKIGTHKLQTTGLRTCGYIRSSSQSEEADIPSKQPPHSSIGGCFWQTVAGGEHLAWQLRKLFLSSVPAPARKPIFCVFRLRAYWAASELPGALSRKSWGGMWREGSIAKFICHCHLGMCKQRPLLSSSWPALCFSPSCGLWHTSEPQVSLYLKTLSLYFSRGP